MATTGTVDERTLPALDAVHEVAQQLRVDGIRCSTKAGSGHPTSSVSELVTCRSAASRRAPRKR